MQTGDIHSSANVPIGDKPFSAKMPKGDKQITIQSFPSVAKKKGVDQFLQLFTYLDFIFHSFNTYRLSVIVRINSNNNGNNNYSNSNKLIKVQDYNIFLNSKFTL